MTAADPFEPLEQARERRSLRAWVKAVDLAIYREIRLLARSRNRVRAVHWFSSLGEYGVLWLGIGAAGVMLDHERAGNWARGAVAVGFAHGASSAIKALIRRDRPAVEDLPHLMDTPTGLSFPSSHSASAFAAARAYGDLLPPAPLYALATLMALSRVHLGVHYPSDVAAGAAVGLLAGSVGR